METIKKFDLWVFFSILLAFYILFVAVCYRFCPKGVIEKKSEYVLFFLLFLALFMLLQGIATVIVGRTGKPITEANVYCGLAFFPMLFVAHLLYPFKKHQAESASGILLFFISLLAVSATSLIAFIAKMMKKNSYEEKFFLAILTAFLVTACSKKFALSTSSAFKKTRGFRVRRGMTVRPISTLAY
jgi:peptidoglycan/LPS O-acetylase OafA/YrhL